MYFWAKVGRARRGGWSADKGVVNGRWIQSEETRVILLCIIGIHCNQTVIKIIDTAQIIRGNSQITVFSSIHSYMKNEYV